MKIRKKKPVDQPSIEMILNERWGGKGVIVVHGETVDARNLPALGRNPGGQPFTYDLFDSLNLSAFGPRGPWFAESSGRPKCCWAGGITAQFLRDSIQRTPSTA